MQLLGKLEIKSKERIIEFLSSQQTGRISSIDENGFPQIIPMNFVFINDAVYIHSHIRGEKLDNIRRNQKVGFEVDKSLEFLPSYFSDPTDASLADTLYISVVIKGNASIVSNKEEKTIALNGLMKKYQPEGGYEPIKPDMDVAFVGPYHPSTFSFGGYRKKVKPADIAGWDTPIWNPKASTAK